MSEIFEGYERQYCELSANLSRKSTSVLALVGEEKKHKLSELKTGLDEAESLGFKSAMVWLLRSGEWTLIHTTYDQQRKPRLQNCENTSLA
jgi:hypothetical protein